MENRANTTPTSTPANSPAKTPNQEQPKTAPVSPEKKDVAPGAAGSFIKS